MRCVITFGPTYEPLDEVRRLTNFSTGRLGTEFGNFLASQGHEVIGLRGHYSTFHAPLQFQDVREFTTTESLLQRFKECSQEGADAIFHAAAVSDFKFGRVFESGSAELVAVQSGKFSTRSAGLLVELIPTVKVISHLRDLFPHALIFGWKFEVDGTIESVLEKAAKQIRENRTDFCVANGPAYGAGFGLQSVREPVEHFSTAEALYRGLLRRAAKA